MIGEYDDSIAGKSPNSADNATFPEGVNVPPIKKD